MGLTYVPSIDSTLVPREPQYSKDRCKTSKYTSNNHLIGYEITPISDQYDFIWGMVELIE